MRLGAVAVIALKAPRPVVDTVRAALQADPNNDLQIDKEEFTAMVKRHMNAL